MTTGVYWVGLAAGLTLVLLVFEMVRRRYLRGRFAVIWVVLGSGAALVALFPRLLETAADLVGVKIPLNLLLFATSVAIAILVIQLSAEAGRAHAQIRVLAEEVALFKLRLQALESATASVPPELADARLSHHAGQIDH